MPDSKPSKTNEALPIPEKLDKAEANVSAYLRQRQQALRAMQTERQKMYGVGVTTRYDRVDRDGVGCVWLVELRTGKLVKNFRRCPNDLCVGCDCDAHVAISEWLKSTGMF